MIDLTADEPDSQAASLQQQLREVEEELDEVGTQIEELLHRQAGLRTARDRLQRQLHTEERAPRADWAAGPFPWDAEVDGLLRDVFGLPSFRPLQREVINATLHGRDVLCLLPSGGGKSLLYQLPALVALDAPPAGASLPHPAPGGRSRAPAQQQQQQHQGAAAAAAAPGLTVVVSPLLSLIQDQVRALVALGVPAAAITSHTPKDEIQQVYRRMGDGDLRLLYCTPERVVNSRTMLNKLEKIHKAGRLARVAIDEAHCCSSWGNDFRKDYKLLGLLKQQFPTVPVIALTATATQQVCEDVVGILRIEGCELFRASINRPNLMYEVRHKAATPAAATAELAQWIQDQGRGASGIVYCLTRKDTDKLAAELTDLGLECAAYHADMDAQARESGHALWSAGKVQVIVATIAFGMGINKADVRWVVHSTLSKSLENYYQESGRAGRDGLPAACLLYYRASDALRQAAVSCMEPRWDPNLRAVLAYAAAPAGRCRRAALQAHFGEAPAPCRGMCDMCVAAAAAAAAADAPGSSGDGGGAEGMDITEAAVGALSVLQTIQSGGSGKATLNQLADAWRGRKHADARARSAAAALGGRDEAEAVVGHLLLQRLAGLEFGFTAYNTNTYLQVTPAGASFLDAAVAGRRALRVQGPLLPQGLTAVEREVSDDAGPQPRSRVVAALTAARADLARAQRVYPVSVLPAPLLRRLAVQAPCSQAQMQQLLGTCAAEAYGAQLLAVLRDAGAYAEDPQQEEQGPTAAAPQAQRGSSGRGGAAEGPPPAAHTAGAGGSQPRGKRKAPAASQAAAGSRARSTKPPPQQQRLRPRQTLDESSDSD